MKLAILMLACLVSLSPGALLAAEGEFHGHPEDRTLGGYRFISSNNIPDPFITSHFRNATGAGIAVRPEIPLVIIENDTLLALDGDVAFILLEFEYQHAASDRIAFRFSGSGASRLGTGGESILTQGITAVTGFNVGTSIAVMKKEDTLFTLAFDIFHGSGLRIDLLQFVENLVSLGPDLASLTQKDDGVSLALGLRGAHAFTPWFGIHGMMQGAYRNSVHLEEGGLLFSLAGSMDFGQKGGAPIGILGSVAFDNVRMFDRDARSTLSLGGGVYYTGREEFVLGLETNYQRIPQRSGDATLNGATFLLTTRFFF